MLMNPFSSNRRRVPAGAACRSRGSTRCRRARSCRRCVRCNSAARRSSRITRGSSIARSVRSTGWNFSAISIAIRQSRPGRRAEADRRGQRPLRTAGGAAEETAGCQQRRAPGPRAACRGGRQALQHRRQGFGRGRGAQPLDAVADQLGEPLEVTAERVIWEPLGMVDTRYCRARCTDPRIAPRDCITVIGTGAPSSARTAPAMARQSGNRRRLVGRTGRFPGNAMAAILARGRCAPVARPRGRAARRRWWAHRRPVPFPYY